MKRLRIGDLLKRGTMSAARTDAEKEVARARRESLADHFLTQIRGFGIPEPVREFAFVSGRKYRADFAWPEYRLDVEVDGGILGMGRRGGHTSVTGMLRDQERNAEAAIAGWAVIRVSRKTIDNGQAVAWVRRWFEGRENDRDQETRVPYLLPVVGRPPSGLSREVSCDALPAVDAAPLGTDVAHPSGHVMGARSGDGGENHGMTAEQILDILERKAKGAFVRELGIYDQAVVDSARERLHAKHRGDEVPELIPGSWIRRIDALDFSSATRTAFEVKISRSDWRRESEEKRRAWHSVTHRYIYVSPADVIPVDEVPNDCGLWWIYMDPTPDTDRSAPRIQVMRKAPKNSTPSDLPWRVAMNLCYREQKLRNEVARRTRDFQAERRRGDRLVSELQAVVPGWSEYNGR